MAQGFEHRLNSIAAYGFDWDANDWLGEATINSSNWVATPAAGINLTNADFDATTTQIMIEVTTPGSYRVTNSITASDGSTGSDDLFIATRGVALEGSYLSVSDAELRLWGRYRIEGDLTEGDLVAATREIDAMGPWIGYKYDSGQELAFPRSITPSGDAVASDAIPDDVLDSVCLLAHHIATDVGPAVSSESVLDRSLTYATPKESKELLQVDALLLPYYRKAGYRK